MKIAEVKELLAGEPTEQQLAELAQDERSGVQKLVASYYKRQEKLKAAKQKFYEFKRQIQYKAEMYGIKVVEVDRFYASSKTCSHCGHIKKDLKLSDRTYVCF